MHAPDMMHQSFLANKHFGSLDGLRCLSIVLVIWHHAAGDQLSYFQRGYLGVDLFFVISGFLITTLLLRERELSGRISLLKFYSRRTLRIFPLYYAVLGLYVVLVWTMKPATEADQQARAGFFHNLPFFLTYTSNWFVDLRDGQRVIFYFVWSLAVEEQFYLLWPGIVRASRRWYVPVLVVGALAVVNETLKGFVAAGVASRENLMVRILVSIATPICLGCILAYALQYRGGFRVVSRFLHPAWSAPLALGALISVLVIHTTPVLLVYLIMTWLVGACCIRSDHPLVPLLANPAVVYIGTVSYGMYLFHMLALHAARRVISADWLAATFVVGAILAVGLATLSRYFYEAPFLRLKERFQAVPKPAIPPEPVALYVEKPLDVGG